MKFMQRTGYTTWDQKRNENILDKLWEERLEGTCE
jgi:hypothetical protein